jgi:drug/metabolite transporter (DMT)-like permease
MPSHKNPTIFYILMFIAMIGWGAAWVHAKYLSEHMSVNEIIFYRYLITTVSMLPVLLWMKQSLSISLRALIVIVIASVVMILYMWLFIEGTHLGTAGLGGAFVTTLIPIVTFGLSAILKKQNIKRKDALALILGAVGVMTILNVWSFSGEQIFRLENLYFVLAALLWSILTIISSKVSSIGPMVYSFYLYLITTIIEGLFVADFQTDMASVGSLTWVNLLSIALFSTTFATSIYFVGGQKIGADKISSFTFLVPFSAIGLSALFLGEGITVGMIAGTLMAVAAIYILNKK